MNFFSQKEDVKQEEEVKEEPKQETPRGIENIIHYMLKMCL